jgi:hypothetical protein
MKFKIIYESPKTFMLAFETGDKLAEFPRYGTGASPPNCTVRAYR